MKKKRSFKVLLLLVGLFIFGKNVNAESQYEEMARAAQIADKITYEYEIVMEKTEKEFLNSENGEQSTVIVEEPKFVFKIHNIEDGIYIVQKNDKNSDTVDIFYENTSNGVYTFETTNKDDIINYTFEVYSNLDQSRGEQLSNFLYTKPKENPFASLEVCQTYYDSEFCEAYITKEINIPIESLYQVLSEEALLKEKEAKTEEGIKGIISNYYVYFIVGIVVISLAVVTVVLIRKRRNKAL